MAETAAILRTRRNARVSYLIVFEGIPLVFTQDVDVTGLKLAWAGTDWEDATWRSGLDVRGAQLKQSIEPFKPSISPPYLQLSLTDPTNQLAQILKQAPSATADWTYLDVDLDNEATSMTVRDTSEFSASGDVYIGGETIGYSGKTATTFTGLTRGKYSLWLNSNGDSFGRNHRLDQTKDEHPRVSKWPRRGAYNRGVQVWLHHYGETVAGGGPGWAVKSQAKLVFQGRIKSVRDRDGKFALNIASVMELLTSEILAEQFTADLAEGIYLTSTMANVHVTERVQGSAVVDQSDTLTTGAAVTWQALIQQLNDLIAGLTLTFDWAFQEVDGRVALHVNSTTGNNPNNNLSTLALGLHPELWRILGFSHIGAWMQFDGTPMIEKVLYRQSDAGGKAHWELGAEEAPVVMSVTKAGVSTRLYVENAKGSWSLQPPATLKLTLPADTEGLVAIGDSAIYAAKYDAGGGYLTLYKDLTSYFQRFGYQGSGGLPGTVREGELGRLQVRQVWYEPASTLAELVLRLMLSTGTEDFNSPDYDKNPWNMGAAVPYSVIDRAAFLELGSYSAPIFLDKPQPLSKLLNSICATYGMYIMLDTENGKITMRPFQLGGVNIAATWALTESNKARRDDRSSVEYGAEGVVNKFELKHGRNLKGDFSETVQVEDLASITDFDERRVATVEAWCIGVGEQQAQLAADWITRVAAQGAVASRPQTRLTRTINYSLLDVMPCDTVTATDPRMIDPATGERGVASLPGVAVGASVDLETLSGEVEVAFWPDLQVDRTTKWGPTARVDETASNAGYVVVSGSSRYLQCVERQYAHSSQDVDVSFFVAGDKIDIIEWSPTNPASPTVWSRTIESVDTANNRIYLTAVLSSPSWSTSLKYIITSSSIASVQTSQKVFAFVAEEATNSTGAVANDAYVWGAGAPSGGGVTTRTYTETYRRQHQLLKLPFVDSRSLDVGHFHDAALGANNAWAYKTRSAAVRLPWLPPSGARATGTDDGLVLYPIWVPLYHWGRRNLIVKILARSSSGGTTVTFTARVAAVRPTGAVTAPSWGDAITVTADVATASGSFVWLDIEIDLAGEGAPLNMHTPPGVWLTIQCDKGSGGGAHGQLRSLCAVEDEGA